MNDDIFKYLIDNKLNFNNKHDYQQHNYNHEFKTFSFNLGRQSGKSTSIINSANTHKNLKFLVLFLTKNQQQFFYDKIKDTTNIDAKYISEYNYTNYDYSNYDVIVIEDYTYNNKETTNLLEQHLYSVLNEIKPQILIKLG